MFVNLGPGLVAFYGVRPRNPTGLDLFLTHNPGFRHGVYVADDSILVRLNSTESLIFSVVCTDEWH